MAEPLTCPFCGFESTTSGEWDMVQHIDTKHFDNEGAMRRETSVRQEVGPSRESNDDVQAHSSQRQTANMRSPSTSTHRRRVSHATTPRGGDTSHQQQQQQQQGRVTRTPSQASPRPKSTVRSAQPSVIQAWKDLFTPSRFTSRSGSSTATAAATYDAKRVRHKSKLDDKSRHHQHPQPPSERSSSSRYRGESTTPGRLSGSQRRGSRESREPVGVASTKLGRSELGRHYNEKHMPTWLVGLLEDSQGVCNKNIIPVLQQLLQQSKTTEYAYLSSPHTQHISKLRREGSFCGYRNIQMLTSFIIASGAPGSRLFGETFPTIFQIQDLVENAWDAGYNTQGRAETGGIRGTRKYIGTPEAQALFNSLNIPCPVQAFKDQDKARARVQLMRSIESYFRRGATGDNSVKVTATGLPPIYLQHRGHSLTIVGFEKQKDKGANLLVFDPSFRDSGSVKGLVGKTFELPESKIASLLDPYRRGARYFRRYGEFEVLYLTDTAPASGVST